VHRDISPHNVLMTRFGEVKLVDFGLAKASSHLTDEDEDIVRGKFGYLAPEVTRGEGGDHRVDIFAAGILLWEMLAGRRLFHGESDVETFKMVRACQIPDLRRLRADVNDDLMGVVLRALDSDPKARYPTANDFARDLSRVMKALPSVTYQDLAAVVTEAANARARRRKAENKDQSGVLGDVIIDALHEFSNMESLLPPDKRSERPAPTAAKEEGFVNPSEWGLDDALGDFLNERQEEKPASPPPPARPPPRAKGPPPTPSRRPPPKPASQDGPWWKKWWG
jgi:serine/threonine-protein kinase